MIDSIYVVEQYVNKKRSFKSIADELGTFPNAIRRIAIANGVIPRNKSDAHEIAIQSGRAKHPTEGKKRSQEIKDKIAIKLVNKWNNMSKEDKKKKSETARENWNNRSETEKEKFNKASTEGIHRSSKEGSKLEKYIYKYLTNEKINVEYHKDNLIANHKLHLDLFLPEHLTIIEIDGPSHFLPIWGEEALQKTIRADMDKNGLILSAGFVIIRVKQVTKSISKIRMKMISQKVLTMLKDIFSNFPPLEKRLIEIEI
jgi:very-short-patch-repair endonuclease